MLACRFLGDLGGVKVQELSAGSGPAAETGDTVVVDYVLRRNNGVQLVLAPLSA